MHKISGKFHNIVLNTVTSVNDDVAENISVVEGNDRISRQNAFHIMSQNAHINSVIMLNNDVQARSLILDKLNNNTQTNECITLKYNASSNKFGSYSSHSTKNDDRFSAPTQLDQSIYNHWQDTLVSNDGHSIKLLSSRLIVWNNYQNTDLKIHIDPVFNEHNFRMIDCVIGDGTVVFSNKEFEIKGQNVRPIAETRHGWAVPEGSSLLIREVNKNAVELLPSIHAHGVSSGCLDHKKRLLIRSDYTFD